MNRRLLALLVLFQVMAAGSVLAQTYVADEPLAALFTGPHFWIALVVGVVLAAGFQILMTNLSVAAGVSLVGPLDTKAKRREERKAKGREPKPTTGHPAQQRKVYSEADAAKYEREFERKYEKGEYEVKPGDHEEDDEGHAGPGKTLQKINAAFGAWTLVTASLSLFFATWLAVELSLTYSLLAGAVLGLAIWGLFYGLMLYFEVAALSSMVGTMVRTATAGMRSVYDTATSVFTRSPEHKIADTAARVTAEVKQELLGDLDTDRLRKQLQQYVGGIENSILNPTRLRQELSKVLDDTEMEAVLAENSPYFDTETVVARLKSGGHPEEKARQVAGKLKDAVSKIRDESGKPKSRSDKVVDAAMRVAGVPAGQAEKIRNQWEQYLRNTGKAELEPESIKRDLERIFQHPGDAAHIIRDRAEMFDRDSIISLLEQRPDMDRRDAEKVVDRIMNVLSVFRGRTGEGVEGAKGAVGGVQAKIEGKIAGFLDGLNRPELGYEGVKDDLKTLFSHPGEGAEAMKRRLQAMDRDTLKAIIASRRDMDHEDAEHLLQQIESARDEALAKAEHALRRTKSKLKDARDEALHQAEEMRKAAASAAWWAFGTALVSGIAAALGGMVAVWT